MRGTSMLSGQRRCQTEQNGVPFRRLPGTVRGEPTLHALPYDARSSGSKNDFDVSAQSSLPHRHRGFSPLSQHTAVSSATSTTRHAPYATGDRCGGTSHALATTLIANSSSTTQPCHATGNPHPQP